MLIVGLTGNYGMGKSSVLGMFGQLGAITLDADEIVDKLLDEKSVLEGIRKTLGDGVFSGDGRLDRAKVAAIIFNDVEKRNKIEDILHPLVFKEIDAFIEGVRNKDTVVIIEVPLVFEKGYGTRFHRTITVYTDKGTALKRLEKSGVKVEDALLRMNVQMPVEEKIRMADLTIDNSDTLSETEVQVKRIYKSLVEEIKKSLVEEIKSGGA